MRVVYERLCEMNFRRLRPRFLPSFTAEPIAENHCLHIASCVPDLDGLPPERQEITFKHLHEKDTSGSQMAEPGRSDSLKIRLR